MTALDFVFVLLGIAVVAVGLVTTGPASWAAVAAGGALVGYICGRA